MQPQKLSDTKLAELNKQLSDLFGVDTVTGQQMYRFTWSDDEYEMRLTEYTDSGLQLLTPEVRKLPKYKQWVQHRYVLEHLVGVPLINAAELPVSKTSYELLFVYEDKKGEYLPPSVEATKLIVATIEAAMQRSREGRNALHKYVDDEYSQEASIEAKNKRLAEIEEYLGGEDSGLGGNTISGQAIIVPSNYEKSH